MVGLSLPFSKKHSQEQVIPGKGFVPVDRVREMAGRGFSEPEMIDILRREGFSADEVDKALTQALRIGVTGEQPQQPQQQQQWKPTYQRPQQQEEQFQWPAQRQQRQEPRQQQQRKGEEPRGSLPTIESIGGMQPQDESMPQIPETSLPEGYYTQQYSNEDYVDYIVQQRMSEVTEKMEEYQSRYRDLQKRIEDLTAQLKAAGPKQGRDHSQVASKMDAFSETVTDVDNRLSGLEKAFKETLPELIDSVRTLSDIVQKVRKEKE